MPSTAPTRVVAAPPCVRRPLAARAAARALAVAPGLSLAFGIAVLATIVARGVPVVGAPVIAVVTGLAIAGAGLPASLRPGIELAGRRVLQAAIVVLGLDLSLHEVLKTGLSSLPVLIGTLVAALAAAHVVGRRLGLRPDVTTLIGIGTAICGASAIAATEAVIGAAEADVAYAVATIFTFNIVAVLSYPALGHLMGLSQHAFGLWAGTAINDTSSVVAAANNYGHGATSYAVVVKLTRTLAIVPICGVLSWWSARRRAAADGGPAAKGGRRTVLRRVVPGFIGAFLLAVVLDTLGVVPGSWRPHLSSVSTFLVTAALAAIGCSARFAELRRAGGRPMLLGAALWLVVCLTSLGLQAATGTL